MTDFSRTQNLIGREAMTLLTNSRVAVFGVGGVGGFTVEALARSGVGAIDLIDHDTVDPSNINRQIIALNSTVGKPKVEIFKERILDINPECRVNVHQIFYLPETRDQFNFKNYDYVVDAVDTVTAKIALIEEAKKCDVPIISSMGTGNKLDPMAFKVADISETRVCPLAKVMRHELKKRGIESVKVVYSEEEPINKGFSVESENLIASRRPLPSSIAFVPSVAGLLIAKEIVMDLINK